MAKKESKEFQIEDFKILYDNVIVKKVAQPARRGVIMPETYEGKPDMGEVVAVGEGRIFDNGHIEPLRIKVGDIVYFNKYSFTKLNIGGIEYMILREEDIAAYAR